MSKIVRTISILFLCLFMASCAQKNIQPFAPVDLSQKFGGTYQSKVDKFHVIFDASSSMYMDYNKEMKFKQSKRTLNNMNQTIPKIDVIGGIRAFGPDPYSLSEKNPLLYGMTKYLRDDFAAALNSVKTTGGGTPLATAINIAADDLGEKDGKIALIVISDAEEVGNGPVEAAKALKNKYADKICIYTILIGDNPTGKKIMTDIATAGGCGFATDYAALNSPAGMADFVEKVFLERASDKDSDGDGVYDSVDRCPNTPQGDKVDQYGCTIVPPVVAVPAAPAPQIDSDRDGVFDQSDRCPGTPYGIKVDQYGCPLPITKTSIELRVEFDVDKYFIRPEYSNTLKEFANFMNENPKLIVTIEGHTDNTGGEKYNQQLSEKRAKSVAQYLNTYFNVDANRIKSIGYGESKPETTNDTNAGRQKNRRVMAVLRTGK